ncbi:hypothetical protein NHF40_02595 [Maricaulaceae bacterium EIL42A08]|nr:hypothetical protein [Maricaulaceae bacterium EIL42A08]
MFEVPPDASNASGTSRYQYDGAALIAHSNTSGSLIQTNSYDAFGVPGVLKRRLVPIHGSAVAGG